jgi:ankyrin repeat protein
MGYIIRMKGRTMLHDAVHHGGSIQIKLEYLIKIGLDPKAVDHSGNNLFHEAILSTWLDVETLEVIFNLGVDLDQSNYAGYTPLHLLLSLGHDEPFINHHKTYIE